ncbi:hypothetical protein E4U43_003405, partial [Claviceps pusilla]
MAKTPIVDLRAEHVFHRAEDSGAVQPIVRVRSRRSDRIDIENAFSAPVGPPNPAP